MSQRPPKAPPRLPGALPLLGHIPDFGKNPHDFMMRLRAKLGDIAEFQMFHQDMVLMTGAEASEAFYRAPDEVLDQGPAYKLMTPIFGEGVVFDAPIQRKNEQLQMLMPALRDKPMRTYSEVIAGEVEQMTRAWGESGSLNLLDFTKELTIYTASHCLLGPEFRYELSAEFAAIYRDLEHSIQPIAYVFPNLPLPIFRRRDKARVKLHGLVAQIMEKRAQSSEKSTNVFQMLIDAHYEDGSKLSSHEITGMLTAAVFAGHHTSSGTAAWVLIELLRHPEELRRVVAELDALFGEDGPVTFESLRQMPRLENVIKEVLRLHPPLILLLRKVMQDFQVGEYVIPAGKFVCAAPAVTHRIPELFPDPERFDPDRYSPERGEDRNLYGWQAFGGGRHKCSGNAFALFQLKVIFSLLLRRYDFELVNPPESYRDDYTKMVVEPVSPCLVRYRRRETQAERTAATSSSVGTGSAGGHQIKVAVDWDLCKGHANCMTEAPEVFQVDDKGRLTVLDENPSPEWVEKLRAAEKYCPTRAIKVEDGETEGGRCPFH
ncbi:sterol 14-demethylase [Methylomagnum ishizawai]|uniref:Sterol 14-demethylase n=1 Tax=Methylomagnum ishizawai TaxID=1760988 RepID=A0A1Y6CV67_9GAMM|nr:cytochrome P450 [Methylomagnum ishizawai]SMF94196.1 sterol 14-demethylase [Methylomagnum ishizawai]